MDDINKAADQIAAQMSKDTQEPGTPPANPVQAVSGADTKPTMQQQIPSQPAPVTAEPSKQSVQDLATTTPGTTNVTESEEAIPSDEEETKDVFSSGAAGTTQSRGSKVLLGILVVVMLGSSGFIFYGYSKLSKNGGSFIDVLLGNKDTTENVAVQQPQNQAQESETSIEAFIENFSSNDYKVTGDGTVILGEESTGNDNGEENVEGASSSTTTIDLSNITSYYRRGELVASVEVLEDGSSIKYILDETGNLYGVDDSARSYYMVYDINSPENDFFLKAFTFDPLYTLYKDISINETELGKLSENIWETTLELNVPRLLDEGAEVVPLYFHIELGESGSMVQTITAFKDKDSTESLGKLSFNYEKIENLDEIITIPDDYTESSNQE